MLVRRPMVIAQIQYVSKKMYVAKKAASNPLTLCLPVVVLRRTRIQAVKETSRFTSYQDPGRKRNVAFYVVPGSRL